MTASSHTTYISSFINLPTFRSCMIGDPDSVVMWITQTNKQTNKKKINENADVSIFLSCKRYIINLQLLHYLRDHDSFADKIWSALQITKTFGTTTPALFHPPPPESPLYLNFPGTAVATHMCICLLLFFQLKSFLLIFKSMRNKK
jgi:hypothetical protein